MTTSISNPETSLATSDVAAAAVPAVPTDERLPFRPPHTLASRFLFLIISTAIVLTALAYGTVHYWALSVFWLGALGILIFWLLDGWKLGTLRVSRNALQLPLLGMLVLACVQLLPVGTPVTTAFIDASSLKTLSLDPYSTRLVIVQLTSLLIYFAAVLVFTDTPHRFRLLVRTITIFGFFLAIFGLTQSFTSPTKVYWIRELPQSTAFGPFINRHHFAGYMELTLALPLGLLFTGSLESEKRFIYLFAAVLMGVALIMTNSRGGIISLVAEILFLATVAGFRRKRKGREPESRSGLIRSAATRAALALALIVALFAGVVLLGGESVLTRFVGTVNSEDPTTGRVHFWSVAVAIIQKHPVIGSGLGAFGLAYTRYDSHNGQFRLEQAHNDYLQILSDGGTVAAVIALVFVIMLFRMGFSRRQSRDNFRRGVATGALAGCFAVLVHSFFDFTLHTTSNALLFLILAGLATINGRVEQVTSRHRKRRHRHHFEVASSSTRRLPATDGA